MSQTMNDGDGHEQLLRQDSKKNQLKFPVQRVKKIVQENQDVGKINNVVPYVLTKSLELFLTDILSQCHNQVKDKKLSKATPGVLKAVLQASKYEFMKEFANQLPKSEEPLVKKKKQQHEHSHQKINKKIKKGKKQTSDSEDEYY
ncbi:DR1-associated protein 1 (negative cofactor 2 alpha) [Paramecium bursaria]